MNMDGSCVRCAMLDDDLWKENEKLKKEVGILKLYKTLFAKITRQLDQALALKDEAERRLETLARKNELEQKQDTMKTYYILDNPTKAKFFNQITDDLYRHLRGVVHDGEWDCTNDLYVAEDEKYCNDHPDETATMSYTYDGINDEITVTMIHRFWKENDALKEEEK